MKTYSQKTSEINREWWLIDASTLPLGKLAVVIDAADGIGIAL